MAYFPRIRTEYADSPSVDAFGRARQSEPVTLFDSKLTQDDRSLLWNKQFTLNATGSYSPFRSSYTLISSTTIGSHALRQSRQRVAYQPGKSLFCITTQVFGTPTDGVTKRVGLYDDKNGIFVENSSQNINVVLRSYVTGQVVEQVISQSAWNLDKLDGTGVSRHRLDITKAQLIATDIQWLGVGRVRVGFEVSGSIVYCHEFLNSNVSSSVYMTTPDLPIRYEIVNESASTTGTLEQICTSVMSEGGYDPKNLQFSADRGINTLSGVTNAGLYPLISIRVKQAYTGSRIVPATNTTICTSNTQNGYRWALIMNPQVGPIDNASWVSVTSSSVEYDISRNSTNVLTGGIMLASGYGSSATDSANMLEYNTLLPLGTYINDGSDQIVLAVQVVGGTTEQFLGSIIWHEFS